MSHPSTDLPAGPPRPQLIGVGTAHSGTEYSQLELLDLMRVTDRRVRSMFLNSAIERRYLTIPPLESDGRPRVETQGELLAKHRSVSLDMAAEALLGCLSDADADLDDLGHLCCVTSTGFLTPGLSALLMKRLGIRTDCSRLDVVGMGCNAGLNALGPVAGWATANPGRLAVMICVETCSAAYVFDETMRSSVVNSLFGDGAAAVAVRADPAAEPSAGPSVLGFAGRLIPEAIDAMRYDWDEDHGKFSFALDRDIPYVVGAHVAELIDALLARQGLQRRDAGHWMVHSGGKKVIDSVMVNLGLTRHDLRHTTEVLRDHGNLSSGSFLFSYRRLLDEKVVAPGDHGVLMTMGPGSTIEAALIRW